MELKKLLILGKTVKYALYIAFGAYCFKILFTLIFGMYKLEVTNSGPMFYYWQTTQCNREAVKSFYRQIPRNSERVNPVFTTYADNVQFSEDVANIIDENKKITEKDKHKEYSPVNERGEAPLYTTNPGFFEMFVIEYNKNHRIFKNKDKPEDLSKLKKELEFLTFRMAFIEYIKSKNPEMKGFQQVKKADIEAFFDLSNKIVVSPEGNVKGINGEEYKVNHEYANGIDMYRGIYNDFMKIVDALKKEDNIFEVVDAYNFKVNDSVMPLFMKIVRTVGLEEFVVGPNDVKNDKKLKDAINGFVTRMAVIKPLYFDIHVFNKIASYFFFTHSYLGATDTLLKNVEYRGLSEDAGKVKNEGTTSKSNQVKLGNYLKKMAALRNSLILDYFSELLAKNMGKSGFLLRAKDDKRWPLLSLFAYPGVFKENKTNEDLYTSVFNEGD